MARNTSSAPMSPSTMRAIAQTLKHYSERYEHLASAFEVANVESLNVTNAEGLRASLEKIARHLAAANHAFDKRMGDAIVPLSAKPDTKEDCQPLIVAEKPARKYQR